MIVVLLASLAEASDKTKLTAADQKKYSQLLRKGRELQAKKDYVKAMVAFDDALKVAADDATVLTEMGWTAYLAKDLDQAEKYTRKALANQATPSVRGAALYNLGLVREAKADRKGAIAAYSASLKERSNATVRAALAKLDPAAAAALDPFKPQPLAGPFKSVDDYCKTTTKPDDDAEWQCECGKDSAVAKPAVAKPYEALEPVTQKCTVHGTDMARTSYALAIKAGGSWYVGPIADTFENRHCNDTVGKQDIKLDGGRVLVWADEAGDCTGGETETQWTERELVVFGIGASGKPSATPTIVVARKEQAGDLEGTKQTTTVDIALDLVWGKDGALTVKGKTKGGDASVVGKHALAFP